MTKKQIRQQVKNRAGVRKVRIATNGDIFATGEMPRGDGGRRTWTMYVGHVNAEEFNAELHPEL